MKTLPSIALMALFASTPATVIAVETPQGDTVIVPLMEQALSGIPGKTATVITVEYAPGAFTPPHTHPADTIVYVLDGEVEMQVEGAPS